MRPSSSSADFGRRAAVEAQRHASPIAVEPLRRQETNIINSAGGRARAGQRDRSSQLQLMIDFYHLASEREDPAIVLKAREHIRHLHMANPQGRVFPLAVGRIRLRAILREPSSRSATTSASASRPRPRISPSKAPRAIALVRQAFER
jgi:sugar phosphate isomerase/epimerase